jgi:hypothetical protein
MRKRGKERENECERERMRKREIGREERKKETYLQRKLISGKNKSLLKSNGICHILNHFFCESRYLKQISTN